MTSNIDTIYGQKLVALRFKNGNLKQEAISKALGISQQDYSDYERGKKAFGIKFIQQVCDYHGIEVQNFVEQGKSDLIQSELQRESSNNIKLEKVIESLCGAFQSALNAKDETIRIQRELIDSFKKNYAQRVQP